MRLILMGARTSCSVERLSRRHFTPVETTSHIYFALKGRVPLPPYALHACVCMNARMHMCCYTSPHLSPPPAAPVDGGLRAAPSPGSEQRHKLGSSHCSSSGCRQNEASVKFHFRMVKSVTAQIYLSIYQFVMESHYCSS